MNYYYCIFENRQKKNAVLMAILNTLIKHFLSKRIKKIEHFKKHPHDVQQECFYKLIRAGRETEWGRRYDYRTIATPAQFKKRVPVNDYDSLKPYINRVMKGEKKLLWNTPIHWFAKSSGTTSDRSKYIPISKESLHDCHFKGGKDMLALYCNNFQKTKIFNGKSLAMGGSRQITKEKNYSYHIGDLSAIIIQNLPVWAEYIRAPGKKLALHDKWEEKIENMARETLTDNITSLSGVPSWTLLLLKRLLSISDKDRIKDIWPNLEVFFHGGVNFAPYREQYNQLFPEGMNYFETYNASEGFFAIQDRKNSDEMLLLLDYGIYYEFMPLDQLDEENPVTLGLDQVEIHANYALIISTNGGLWRYVIGDTIQFTSLNPYRVQVTGRTKNFINAVGEEVIIDNAENALSKAAAKTGAIITEYTAAPVYFSKDKNAAHEWLIEFESEPVNFNDFVDELDKTLKSLNSDYEAKRYQDMVLREPIVKPVPEKTFYKWMKQRGKLGGQNKVPRLANHRKYIEEILNLIDSSLKS